MENLKAWIGLVESNEIKCCTSCIWIAGDLGLHFLSAWCFQVPWESWDTCAQPQCSFQHFYAFMSHRATDTSHFVFLAKLHSTSSTFGRQSGTKVLVGKSVRKSGVDIFSGRILLDKNSPTFWPRQPRCWWFSLDQSSVVPVSVEKRVSTVERLEYETNEYKWY